MAFEVSTFGNISNGELSILHPKKFFKEIAKSTDCDVEIIVKELFPKRSNPQNAYYHGVVIKLAAQKMSDLYGQKIDPEEAHEYFKYKFNLKRIRTPEGEIIKIAGSTTKLSTAEMSIYIEQIRNFAKEVLDLDIPDATAISKTKDKFNVNKNT